ncbi:MAG: hypothetical protein ACOYL6_09050 [Bacteriovoracaceae bacterium]
MNKKLLILCIFTAISSFSTVFANDNTNQKIGCGIYEIGKDGEKKLISNELTFEAGKDGSFNGDGLLSFEAPEGKREFTVSLWISNENEAGMDGIRHAYVATYTAKDPSSASDSYFLVNIKQNKALFVVRNPLTYSVKGSGDDASVSMLRCLVK